MPAGGRTGDAAIGTPAAGGGRTAMCGIAGVIAWDDRYRTSRQTLARMSAAIAHRGPDGEGLWFNHEGEATPDRPQAALAHRRLAIIDPDPRADQPFTDGRGRWIVFNGEIYNYRELRSEISNLIPDYAWRTNCDTEVLLAAYAAWGERCVEHLNGMFAFAVWDENDKSLFLARDRMGQKPLYVAMMGVTSPAIAFASELGAVPKNLPWLGSDGDVSFVRQYLRYGHVEAPRGGTSPLAWFTFPPGTWNTFRDARSLRGGAYFARGRVPAPVPSGGGADVRELVLRAVQRQLVSDVPLGVFLSGGVDSSVVASCARQFGEIETFSIGFDDPRYDETPYAERVARHLGTRHHTFRVRPDAAEDLPKLAAVFGAPFADSSALPTHYLARETRRHVKVTLSGDGGDELFGGYDRYRAIELSQRVERFVPHFASRHAARHAGGHPKSLATRAGRFFESLGLPPGRRYASYLRIFKEPLLDELLADGFPGGEADPVAETFASFIAEGLRPAEAACATDRLIYLPHDLLTKVDRASMLHGLEVRSPFMDHELVQFAAGLTTDQLLKGGPKRMLREAFADDLPAWVFKRKKMGFAVPIGDWFRGELRPMLRDHLFAADSFARGHFNMAVVERLVDEHETQRVDHSQRLYALLMLELWWRLQR
jgi:asparagine synthase (glutamine-hydrolysing)